MLESFSPAPQKPIGPFKTAVAIVVAALMILYPFLASGDDSDSRARVSGAKVAFEIGDQPDLPVTPPNVPITIKLPSKPLGAASASAVDVSRFAVKIKQTKSSAVNTKYGIITAYHCVQGQPAVTVEMDGDSAVATVVSYDAINDVALLSVKWSSPHMVAEVASTPLAIGDVLTVAGRTKTGLIGVDTHRVIQAMAVPNRTYVENPFVAGQSGSGLFNASGEVAGVCTGNDLTYEPYTGLIVPLAAIRAVIEARGPAAAGSALRAIMWSPVWCGVCIENDAAFRANPDPRIKYEQRKGKPKSEEDPYGLAGFPQEVVDFASQTGAGYPVWQLERPDGGWMFVSGRKTADQIVNHRNSPMPSPRQGRRR